MNKLYETFKAAKKYLIPADKTEPTDIYWDKSLFICHAIRRAYSYGDVELVDANNAIGLVETRLGKSKDGPINTVHTFLEENGYTTQLPQLTSEDFAFIRRQLQAYRHRWLDSLIEEFKDERHPSSTLSKPYSPPPRCV